MEPCLVNQDMRHFRTVVGYILHSTNTFNVFWLVRVWHPKRRLIDPIGFALDFIGETKGLEHFHTARVDAIRFALDDVAGHALDDHRIDLWKLRQLRSKTQTCWACSSYQYIYFFW